jgi:hypothetical protein
MPAKTGTPAPAGFMWIDEVATALSIQINTLYKWRYRGIGPAGVRHAGRLMYAESIVAEYLQGLATASQPGPAMRTARPHVANAA